MEVVAYASLLSLSNFLDRIQHLPRRRLLPNTNQIETLHEKLHFLQEFLGVPFQREINEIDDFMMKESHQDEDLEMKQIAQVANDAVFVIDSHVVDQLHGGSESTTADIGLSPSSFSRQDIDQVIKKVIEKLDSLKESLVKAKGKAVQIQQQPVPIVSVGPGSSTLLPSRGNDSPSHVVGFDDHLVEILKLLTGHQLNLQIIPIVGMGGIGKTTLARLVFEHKFVVEHFDKRVWFTISQEYSVHEILLGVLRAIGVPGDLKSETLAELGLLLHQQLSGRRYLIVMDDLWSTNGWDDFKLSFPNDKNGSRVIVTTRLNDLAVSLGSQKTYTMDFLDEDKSWQLLREKVFTKEICSPELEKIGKKIAKGCKGLPLAIVVIGGLLAKSNMTQEYWESVAEKLNCNPHAILKDDHHCFGILALSYHHLPIYLKPCFLYMRDYDKVRVSKLIKLWIAEGFLKPSRAKSMEEVADEYLKDLIDRNLILIHEWGHTGKIKTCGVHDLLRDLCMTEYGKKGHFCVPKVQHIELETRQQIMCFLCSRRRVFRQLYPVSQSSSLVTHRVCNHCEIMYPHLVRSRYLNVRLLVSVESLLPSTLQYLSLKDLRGLNSVSCLNFQSFSSLPLIWNLQTLIIDGFRNQPIVLPSEIWEMLQLKHINIESVVLPNPVDNQIERKDCIILENLHTLSEVVNFIFTKEVLERIPNVKKLRITCFTEDRDNWSYYSLDNLARLSKLESLFLRAEIFSSIIAFPFSLKKLALNGCRMPWKHMTIVGSLYNLEVLKLSSNAFVGPDWDPVEGEFRRLKFLSLREIDLVSWRAENVHFPSLESLVLQEMHDLEEIPPEMGDIATLRSIDLIFCSEIVINSAERITEEQRAMGNDALQLYVTKY